MRTLCINCDNRKSCNWKSDHVILCNEYTLKPVPKVKHTPPYFFQGTSKVTMDLCTTCTHGDTCLFKTEGINTTYCEEFQ